MQDLINRHTETTPFLPFPPSPGYTHDRPTQGHSPTKRHTADMEKLFDFQEEIVIPDKPLTEEEALHFSQQLDLAEEEEMEVGVLEGMQALQDALNSRLQGKLHKLIE